jgi:hypothetical protein
VGGDEKILLSPRYGLMKPFWGSTPLHAVPARGFTQEPRIIALGVENRNGSGIVGEWAVSITPVQVREGLSYSTIR